MKRPPKRDRTKTQRQTARPNAKEQRRETTPQLVTIEKPIYGGSFLARIDGKAVFVPLVLPGEEAKARIVEEKRGYASAEADEISNRATERVQPLCPYFGACGGCQYQHADYNAQLRFKQAILSETLERAGVRPPDNIDILSGEPWAYRNRIRLAFDAHGNPGYRGRRSHDIIPIEQCPIAAPILVKAAVEFASSIRKLAPSFRPSELALFANHDESSLLVSIIAQQPLKISLEKFAASMREQVPALSGLELVAEGRVGQTSRTAAQWGQTSIAYRAAGYDYRVDHRAFFQVNRWLIDALVERVVAKRRGAVAWDLFAGVGLFARQLTAGFDRVVAVESAPSATAALAHNLSERSAKAVRSSTHEFLHRSESAERPDLIVVDPPRTGLGAEVTSLLGTTAASRITYVSCDPATLARDLRALIAGGYAIERLTLADLFPQTFHLESIVDLIRA